MSSRWTTVVTTAGAALLAGISGHIFNFTKAQCGSGTVAEEDLASQTTVTDMVKNLSITAVSHTDNNAKLRLQLTNASVEEGFDLHQIGIFAKLDTDPTDVLFMIIQADVPDYVPSADESPNFVNDYVVNVFVGSEAIIEGNIDLAAYVTIGMLTDTETVSGAQAKANAAQAAAEEYADDADAAHIAADDPHTQYAKDSDLTDHSADTMPHQSGLNLYASGLDANGVYTVCDYKRADNTLYMRSTLSGGTSPNYTTDTWQFYNAAGTTVISTKTWTLTYDANGKITSKVVA